VRTGGCIDVTSWSYWLETLVFIGMVAYVLMHEHRMDARRHAAETGPKTDQTSAELVTRAGARLIDHTPFSIIYTALNFFFDLGYLLPVGYVVVVYVYFVLLDTYAGTTLGKRVLGLRVIGPAGTKPEFRQSATREAFILVSALVGVIPYAGDFLGSIVLVAIAWTISNSPTKQGKHDQLAGGTRVVDTRVAATGPA
jgi:uncharacterized RDD family membrane protein YckC